MIRVPRALIRAGEWREVHAFQTPEPREAKGATIWLLWQRDPHFRAKNAHLSPELQKKRPIRGPFGSTSRKLQKGMRSKEAIAVPSFSATLWNRQSKVVWTVSRSG